MGDEEVGIAGKDAADSIALHIPPGHLARPRNRQEHRTVHRFQVVSSLFLWVRTFSNVLSTFFSEHLSSFVLYTAVTYLTFDR